MIRILVIDKCNEDCKYYELVKHLVWRWNDFAVCNHPEVEKGEMNLTYSFPNFCPLPSSGYMVNEKTRNNLIDRVVELYKLKGNNNEREIRFGLDGLFRPTQEIEE